MAARKSKLNGTEREAIAKAASAIRVAKKASDQATRVLASQTTPITEQQVEKIVKDTVAQTLAAMGIIIDDPKEMLEFRKDVEYMRAWRETIQSGRAVSMKVIFTVFVTGLLAMLWTAFKVVTTGHP